MALTQQTIAHGAVEQAGVTPRPCPGPSPPPSGPAPPPTSRCRHSPPATTPQAPPRWEGWCSSRSRPESRFLGGSAETRRPPLQRDPSRTRRRSWRRARRTLRGSPGCSPVGRQPSSFSDFSEGSAAFWPCSSWSPSSLPQSQTAPCSLLGSRLRLFCNCEESMWNKLGSNMDYFNFESLKLHLMSLPPSKDEKLSGLKKWWFQLWLLLWLTESENVQTAISARASCGGEVWECNTRRRPYHRYGIYIWTSLRPVGVHHGIM